MSPTQAYIVHNGLLAALPEPPGWQRPGKLEVVLRRVLEPGIDDGEDAEDDLLDATTASPIPPAALPSLPLGSGPDVQVDLLYRRVEAGDLIVLVSSSPARQLDRPQAEEIFSMAMRTRLRTPCTNSLPSAAWRNLTPACSN